jgi:phosphopantothenoylcysteine decarboxylase/phosphopantothenate--cysteine ligase
MNIDAIIETLGGPRQVQTLLGVGPSAVSNYRMRGAFPEYARVKVWQALKARGVTVDPETLQAVEYPDKKTEATSTATPQILLIISGGIAAYKTLELIRRMRDRGWVVRCIMTRSATEFITPLSVSALSEEKVYGDLFSLTDEAEMGHIRLARDTDAVVVAPASANIMAQIAHGLADNLATAAILATDAPVLIAPAMNPFMWANSATQANFTILRQRGFGIVGPESGDMACGEEGQGRLAETSMILDAIATMLPGRGRLSGRHALVTSGPTHEPIDSVRYITNRSSGKQGHAIAASLTREGAQVTLVSGPVDIPPPPGVRYVAVTTAAEMLTASLTALPCDIAVCAAAVADWAVAEVGASKIKKTEGCPPNLNFVENPDILATISQHNMRPRLVVGFAAETDKVIDYATAKRARKKCDWIIANHVGDNDIFGSDENEVHLITANGSQLWPRMAKTAIANTLTNAIIEEISHG